MLTVFQESLPFNIRNLITSLNAATNSTIPDTKNISAKKKMLNILKSVSWHPQTEGHRARHGRKCRSVLKM